MKPFLCMCLFVLTQSLTAQQFTGKAIYKTSKKNTFKIKSDKNGGMSDAMQEQIRKRLQKMNQKTYILEFDTYTSTYKQEVSLKAPAPNVGGTQILSFGGGSSTDVYYKNIKDNVFINKTEIQSKGFLVKDTLKTQDWVLSTDTKNIGNYTCYKATFTKEVTQKQIFLGDKKEAPPVKKVKVTTTAWYTPQIPVTNGPGIYQGLPGLILEINDGTTTIVCTEVILNPKEKINITPPKKGKKVNQATFVKIKRKKSEEMLEKMKSRKGIDMGNGVNIKFGG